VLPRLDGEADTAALLVAERRVRGGHVLRVRVERVDGRGVRGGERREAAFAATDVEALAVKGDDGGNRRRLDPGFVAPLHHLTRLVRLEGGAARVRKMKSPLGLVGDAGVCLLDLVLQQTDVDVDFDGRWVGPRLHLPSLLPLMPPVQF
jgi:hypothetical protein